MKLIQIFLPLADNEGRKFSKPFFAQVKNDLADKYKGVTAFTQNPAEGLWEEAGQIQSDQIIICEVMTPDLDHQWWTGFKSRLEDLFKQDVILIRCLNVEIL